jgi:hypothetical protein
VHGLLNGRTREVEVEWRGRRRKDQVGIPAVVGHSSCL